MQFNLFLFILFLHCLYYYYRPYELEKNWTASSWKKYTIYVHVEPDDDHEQLL